MLGSSGTLPVWVVVLIGGALLNFALGLANPFVPKEYREKAKKFRKGGFRGGAPLVMARAHFSGIVYVLVVVCVNVAFSILFFIESYKNISTSVGGGFLGFCVAILVYLVALTLGSMFLLAAAALGERTEAEQIAKSYRRRYYIMVIFNEVDFGDWIYKGDWARAENLKDLIVKDDEF